MDIFNLIKAKKPSPSKEYHGIIGKLGSYITDGSYLVSTNAKNIPLVFKQQLQGLGKTFRASTINNIKDTQGPGCVDKWEGFDTDTTIELTYTGLTTFNSENKNLMNIGVFVALGMYYLINLDYLREIVHLIGHSNLVLNAIKGNNKDVVYITAKDGTYHGLVMPVSLGRLNTAFDYLAPKQEAQTNVA